jgi:hypothetical protein
MELISYRPLDLPILVEGILPNKPHKKFILPELIFIQIKCLQFFFNQMTD